MKPLVNPHVGGEDHSMTHGTVGDRRAHRQK
jgi:hypothetical protein